MNYGCVVNECVVEGEGVVGVVVEYECVGGLVVIELGGFVVWGVFIEGVVGGKVEFGGEVGDFFGCVVVEDCGGEIVGGECGDFFVGVGVGGVVVGEGGDDLVVVCEGGFVWSDGVRGVVECCLIGLVEVLRIEFKVGVDYFVWCG